MIGRDFPGNPNRRPLSLIQGLQPHWIRTIMLLVIIALLIALRPAGKPANAVIVPPFGEPKLESTPTAQPIAATLVPVSPATPAVQAAIGRANDAFRTARAQVDVGPLIGVATDAWLEYEQNYIAQLRAQGTSERWSLKDLSVTGMVVHEANATVCTNEQWERVTIGAGGTASPATTLAFMERYSLIRQGANWMISEIRYEMEKCKV